MKQVLLDTNFMISCVREKLDFFEELNLMGIEVLIPQEVLIEMNNIVNSKQKLKQKELVEVTKRIVDSSTFKEVILAMKPVDRGIINYAEEHPDTIIGTLDKEIQNKVKNQKLIIRNRKRLEII